MGSLPFAPPVLYGHRPSQSIRDLILMGGQERARAAERSGDIWMNTLGNVGNQIAGGVMAYGEQKAEQKRQEGMRAQEAAVLESINSWDGKPETITANLTRILGPEKGLKMAGDVVRLAGNKQEQDPEKHLKTTLAGIEMFQGLSPEAKAAAWPMFRAQALEPTVANLKLPVQLPEQYTPEIDDMIGKASSAIGGIVGKKEQGPETAVVGGALVDKQTGKVIYQAPPAEAKQGFEYRDLGDAVGVYNAQGELVRKDKKGAAPASATTSYQAKEVLNDEGKPVMANFDSRTGRYTDTTTGQPIKTPKPVPSASETQDARKFKQAGPVLSAVSELSEKINTLNGVFAKAAGAVERQAAKVNLDDNVAEYEALISGFTPLVARALGHTGVLTEQDVQSVKALFPRPGDSKSLRDRKVNRINNIIGALEGGEAPVPSVDPKAQADRLRQLYGTK